MTDALITSQMGRLPQVAGVSFTQAIDIAKTFGAGDELVSTALTPNQPAVIYAYLISIVLTDGSAGAPYIQLFINGKDIGTYNLPDQIDSAIPVRLHEIVYIKQEELIGSGNNFTIKYHAGTPTSYTMFGTVTLYGVRI